MLQKIAEVGNFAKIMDRAMAVKDNDCKRLGIAAIFLLAQYSEVHMRNRKPFNPLLGETYEIIQPHYRLMTE